ncbi:hypothetical protein E3N88_02722 [Mikania micrantha]|uniref:Uncharacterized protein n=1 Tax=Mikania micrantha TaxID=192012 RepID=A0A5N6Q6C7_9ASTR|nr:hypothetical protein E3N88_02722 [Mikania micrantha]
MATLGKKNEFGFGFGKLIVNFVPNFDASSIKVDIIPTMTVQEHAGNDKSCMWHAAILLMANLTMNSSEWSEQDMVMEGRCCCEANEKHLSSPLFHSLMWRSLVRIAAWVLASLCDTLCHCIDRLAIARSPIGEHQTFS